MSPTSRRRAARHAVEQHSVRERAACRLVGVPRLCGERRGLLHFLSADFKACPRSAKLATISFSHPFSSSRSFRHLASLELRFAVLATPVV